MLPPKPGKINRTSTLVLGKSSADESLKDEEVEAILNLLVLIAIVNFDDNSAANWFKVAIDAMDLCLNTGPLIDKIY